MATPTAFLQASPASLTHGGTATLTWVVTNATSQSIDNGIGPVSASGSMAVTPTVTSYYHLTATNGALTAVAQAEVDVLSSSAFFSLQKLIITMNAEQVTPVRGRN